jgi:hypothetical protein
MPISSQGSGASLERVVAAAGCNCVCVDVNYYNIQIYMIETIPRAVLLFSENGMLMVNQTFQPRLKHAQAVHTWARKPALLERGSGSVSWRHTSAAAASSQLISADEILEGHDDGPHQGHTIQGRYSDFASMHLPILLLFFSKL